MRLGRRCRDGEFAVRAGAGTVGVEAPVGSQEGVNTWTRPASCSTQSLENTGLSHRFPQLHARDLPHRHACPRPKSRSLSRLCKLRKRPAHQLSSRDGRDVHCGSCIAASTKPEHSSSTDTSRAASLPCRAGLVPGRRLRRSPPRPPPDPSWERACKRLAKNMSRAHACIEHACSLPRRLLCGRSPREDEKASLLRGIPTEPAVIAPAPALTPPLSISAPE